MEIKFELLTYEKGEKNQKNIAQMMQVLSQEYDLEFCENKAKDLLSFINDGSAIVASAFVGDTLIGYAWGYLRKVKVLRIHVTQLVVHEKYRGMGIGKHLLDLLQDECESRGCAGLELNVAGDNISAQKFYLKNNFICETIFMSKEIKKENTDV